VFCDTQALQRLRAKGYIKGGTSDCSVIAYGDRWYDTQFVSVILPRAAYNEQCCQSHYSTFGPCRYADVACHGVSTLTMSTLMFRSASMTTSPRDISWSTSRCASARHASLMRWSLSK
jgi:hypothetical protein